MRVETAPIARVDGAILTGLGVRLREIDVEQNQRLVRAATYAFYRGSGLRRVSLFPATLRVTEVLEGSPADRTGLEAGDLILGVLARGRFGERQRKVHPAFVVMLDHRRTFGRRIRPVKARLHSSSISGAQRCQNH